MGLTEEEPEPRPLEDSLVFLTALVEQINTSVLWKKLQKSHLPEAKTTNDRKWRRSFPKNGDKRSTVTRSRKPKLKPLTPTSKPLHGYHRAQIMFNNRISGIFKVKLSRKIWPSCVQVYLIKTKQTRTQESWYCTGSCVQLRLNLNTAITITDYVIKYLVADRRMSHQTKPKQQKCAPGRQNRPTFSMTNPHSQTNHNVLWFIGH